MYLFIIMDIGKHCYKCGQLDFLPFVCDKCNKVFCRYHRVYENHDCPNFRSMGPAAGSRIFLFVSQRPAVILWKMKSKHRRTQRFQHFFKIHHL